MKTFLNLSLALALTVTLVGCGLGGSDKSENTEKPTITYETSGDYVGMSVPNAQAKAKAEGTRLRFVEIDGEPQAVTADFVEGRINAKIERGVVTEYTVEGQE